ncbi:MAG: PKD domain-containing protein, partial [Flavobacteriales bacterium]
VADFSAAQTASTLDVAFTDASTDATSYMWDFGDGNTSAMQSPTHTYAADGDYTVCLIAINDCDLDGDTLCELITVNPLPPANDLCADAETVICGQTTSGTNVGGTADASLGGNCGTDLTAGPGVWYTFAGTGDFVTVTTCNIGTDFDTKLGVFSGDCNNLVCVAGNDDDTSGDFGTLCESTGVPGSNRASTVGFLSVQGTDYYFYVTGFLQEQGAFDLSVTCSVPPTAPANDDVCSPQALVMGANGPYSNELATADATDPILPDATDGCNGNDGWCFDTDVENSVWFTFEAPASGNIIVSANGSSFDTQLAVYEAVSCQDFATGTQVQLAANDDLAGAITFGNSEVYLCGLTPAATYFVLVDGYDGAEGDILVTLTETTVDADFTSVATGLSVAFTDASTGAVTYAWDFGDGNTSTDASPTNVYAADGSYTVCLTVTDANGCTSEYCEVIQVAGPVGIVETLEANLSIYPNPSNGQFVVEAKGVDSNAQITVLDMTGRQIYSEGVVLNGSFRKELNLNAAKGTYLLQVFTVEGLVTRKIQIH